MIRGSIATNLMLITLQTLSVFTLIWVMTAGGPGTDSTTLPILAYQEAFKFQRRSATARPSPSVMLVIGRGLLRRSTSARSDRKGLMAGTTTTRAARRDVRPSASWPAARQGATVAANVVLLVIGLCFLLPLAWLVARVPRRARRAHQTRLPEAVTSANFSAVLTPELTLLPLWNSSCCPPGPRRSPCSSPCWRPTRCRGTSMRFNKPFLYVGPVRNLPADHGDHGPGLQPVRAAQPAGLAAGDHRSSWRPPLPMAIWMTKNFMDSVPVSLEEAAWVDGASAMRRPAQHRAAAHAAGIAVVFIFVFIQAWGNFFVPFVLLLSPAKQPAAVSIFSFFGQYGTVAYGQLAAYSSCTRVPGARCSTSWCHGASAAPSPWPGAVKG